MNIFFSTMQPRYQTVLLKKMMDECEKRGHETYYLHPLDGNFIYCDVELYTKMELPARRLNLEEIKKLPYCEYKKYSNDELLNIIEYELNLELLKNSKNKQDILLDKAIRYLENLRYYKEKLGIDQLVIWGPHIIPKTIHAFAKKNNIIIWNLELGYFRPFTLTMDLKGVNYENSVPVTKKFYDDISIDEDRYNKFLKEPEIAIEEFELSRKLDKAFFDHYDVAERHRYISRKLDIPKFDDEIYSSTVCNEKHIFVPFQMEVDSQSILYSRNIKKMFDLVKVTTEAAKIYNEKYNDSIKIVYKPHPLSYRSEKIGVNAIYSYCQKHGNYLVGDINSFDLIKNANALITINSTVGLEGLMENKSIITLGQAFYNIEGLVHVCEEIEFLPDKIQDAINNKPDKEFIKRFLYYLRFHYFEEAYIENTDYNSIVRIVDRMLAYEVEE